MDSLDHLPATISVLCLACGQLQIMVVDDPDDELLPVDHCARCGALGSLVPPEYA